MTVVDPSPRTFCDHLAATVEEVGTARSILRQVIALAADSPALTDQQLRDRLLTLAERAHPAAE